MCMQREMALHISFAYFICMFFFIAFAWPASTANTPKQSNLQTYIVHVEAPHHSQLSSELNDDLESWYRSFLPATTASSGEEEARLVYSYRHVFTGFAARLSPEEVKEMEKKEGFISARPGKQLFLDTTHSPNFLGLNPNTGFWKDSNYGKGVIIGVLDTGALPEHVSFSDKGMPPPPAKWKGKCEFNHTTCNNKIIGARIFSSEYGSPIDTDGHGTHTASTAAGSFVEGANVLSLAKGTAAGVAPLAHLAIYKVCCGEDDVLAGMDAAMFVKRTVDCAVESSIPEAQLNYPSFSLVFTDQSNSQVYTRTVTNVGNPASSYDVVISPPHGIDVHVEPMKLKFSKLNQKMQYKVTFKRLPSAPTNTSVQGFLKWTSPEHSVRSPIAVILR